MPPAPDAIGSVIRHSIQKIETTRSRRRAANGKLRPFVLGLSGLQGSGKSTWAEALAQELRTRHQLKIVILSLDDLYHTHESLSQIRSKNPSNKLFSNRGQPGTHDETLAKSFFAALLAGEEVSVPSYDKSLFDGEGDRAPMSEWERVDAEPYVDVLIFEGWCVGFHALSVSEIEEKWIISRRAGAGTVDNSPSTRMLGAHPLEHIQIINENLRRYNDTFLGPANFDYLVHLDTDNLANVYSWRMQAEQALRRSRGRGMADEEVISFVQAYMPAYELYLGGLQRQAFIPDKEGDAKGNQLRVLLDQDRNVISVTEI